MSCKMESIPLKKPLARCSCANASRVSKRADASRKSVFNHRRALPMAIGRNLPCFDWMGRSVVDENRGSVRSGRNTLGKWRTRFVSAERLVTPYYGKIYVKASFRRKFGDYRSGSAADEGFMERAASKTYSSVSYSGSGKFSGGMGRMSCFGSSCIARSLLRMVGEPKCAIGEWHRD